MPLTMAETGREIQIRKIGGKDETRRFLESLGFDNIGRCAKISPLNVLKKSIEACRAAREGAHGENSCPCLRTPLWNCLRGAGRPVPVTERHEIASGFRRESGWYREVSFAPVWGGAFLFVRPPGISERIKIFGGIKPWHTNLTA